MYAILAAGDFALHAREDVRLGQDWWASSNLPVSFAAALFWPFDLVAHLLLAR